MNDFVLRKLEEHDRRFDTLQRDVDTLKSDVGVLKSDVATLKSDVGLLKEETHHIGLIQESQEQKLTQVLEIVQGIAEQVSISKSLEHQVDNHEHRISALELAYKADHPASTD